MCERLTKRIVLFPARVGPEGGMLKLGGTDGVGLAVEDDYAARRSALIDGSDVMHCSRSLR